MTVLMGRVRVIATYPDVLPVLPFVMSGNPDCRAGGTLPLLIVLPGRRRTLISDLKNHSLSVKRHIRPENCNRRDYRHHCYLN